MAHECILDLRPLTAATCVTVDDVAKRLADYGLRPDDELPGGGHVDGGADREENLAELDAFCDAMIAIRGEIDRWPPVSGPPTTIRCEVLRTLPNVLSQNGITVFAGTGRIRWLEPSAGARPKVWRFAAHRRYVR